jgi:hypothetical protein
VTTITLANLGDVPGQGAVANHATSYSVQLADTGTVFTNFGALGTVIFTLPTPGAFLLNYTFIVIAAQTLEILLPGGTFMYFGGQESASGGNMQSSTPGCAASLTAISTTIYVATSLTGTWTLT